MTRESACGSRAFRHYTFYEVLRTPFSVSAVYYMYLPTSSVHFLPTFVSNAFNFPRTSNYEVQVVQYKYVILIAVACINVGKTALYCVCTRKSAANSKSAGRYIHTCSIIAQLA